MLEINFVYDLDKCQSSKIIVFLVMYSSLFIRRFRKIMKKRILASLCLSVCLSAWNNSTSTGRILIKFGIHAFFENLLGKFKSY